VANILFNTLARSLLQVRGAREMQGRVMAVHVLLSTGTTPIGAPLLGWVCEVAGSAWAFVLAGGSALLAAAAVGRRLLRTPSTAAGEPVPVDADPGELPVVPASPPGPPQG
jgi:hypothetical protein